MTELGTLNEDFFGQLTKYDKPKEENKKDADNEMISKTSNLKLEDKWNFKLQFNTEFFSELLTFTNQLDYKLLFRLSKKDIKLYTIDASKVCMTFINIEKTEMSEYINTDDITLDENITGKTPDENSKENSTPEEKETLVYVTLDLNDLSLDPKYPTDIYFDTKEKNTMYIINKKTKESVRLNDNKSNDDLIIGSYKRMYEILQKFIKNENGFTTTLNHIEYIKVLGILTKKKGKKDESSSAKYVNVDFEKTEIEFKLNKETSSTSIKMYGEDIIVKPSREVTTVLDLSYLTKFGKLKLSNHVVLYVDDKSPIVMKTMFGAGRIILYFLVAPRIDEE